MSCLLIPYPSSQDIRYAHWLKHFAAQLPDYWERYQLDPLLVLRVQCLALELLELLCCQVRCATASIQHRQLNTSLQLELTIQLSDSKFNIQETVAEVVAHLKQHSASSVADSHKLELLLQGQWPAPRGTYETVMAVDAALRFV